MANNGRSGEVARVKAFPPTVQNRRLGHTLGCRVGTAVEVAVGPLVGLGGGVCRGVPGRNGRGRICHAGLEPPAPAPAAAVNTASSCGKLSSSGSSLEARTRTRHTTIGSQAARRPDMTRREHLKQEPPHTAPPRRTHGRTTGWVGGVGSGGVGSGVGGRPKVGSGIGGCRVDGRL